MSRRQELCRDFQRGNCRYGSRCKFLHELPQQQQQQKPQQQQRYSQQRNQFGGGGNYYNVLGNNANTSNQRQTQSQNNVSKEHRCNDPRICKEQIREDMTSEHPVFWRLTCYAHYKFLQNDIVGDVSPEELRGLAYEGAKQGLSLHNVVQREKLLMAAKNAEFDALLKNPYKGPVHNSQGFQSSSFTSSPFLSPLGKTSIFTHSGQPANIPTAGSHQGFSPAPFAALQQHLPVLTNPGTVLSVSQNPVGTVSARSQSPFPNMQESGMVLNQNAFQSPLVSVLGSSTNKANNSLNQSLSGFSTLGTAATFQNPSISPVLSTPVSQTSPISRPQVAPVNSQDTAIWFQDVWKIGEIPEGEPPAAVRF